MKDLEIQKIEINSLKLSKRNARFHGERNHEAIKRSLIEFGQVEPLLVRRETMEVIGGNGRLQVMKELNYDVVNVVLLDISDKQALALGIALNKTAETAEWDFPILGEILKELDEKGFNLENTGFASYELEPLLQSWEPELPDQTYSTLKPNQKSEPIVSTTQIPINSSQLESESRKEEEESDGHDKEDYTGDYSDKGDESETDLKSKNLPKSEIEGSDTRNGRLILIYHSEVERRYWMNILGIEVSPNQVSLTVKDMDLLLSKNKREMIENA